jgi:hypothetical protein
MGSCCSPSALLADEISWNQSARPPEHPDGSSGFHQGLSIGDHEARRGLAESIAYLSGGRLCWPGVSQGPTQLAARADPELGIDVTQVPFDSPGG